MLQLSHQSEAITSYKAQNSTIELILDLPELNQNKALTAYTKLQTINPRSIDFNLNHHLRAVPVGKLFLLIKPITAFFGGATVILLPSMVGALFVAAPNLAGTISILSAASLTGLTTTTLIAGHGIYRRNLHIRDLNTQIELNEAKFKENTLTLWDLTLKNSSLFKQLDVQIPKLNLSPAITTSTRDQQSKTVGPYNDQTTLSTQDLARQTPIKYGVIYEP